MKNKTWMGVAAAAAVGAAGWYWAAGSRRRAVEHLRREAKRLLAVRRDELAALCGLTNAFSDVEGWAQISEEQVLQRNPDYIVTVTMYYGEGPTPQEEIMSRAGWQDVTAVAQNQVFQADNDRMTRPGPRLMDAAQALYDFVYATQGEQAA